MIQRIQTIFLSLTTLFSIIFLNGTILTFIDKSGSVTKVTIKGIMKAAEGSGLVHTERLVPLTALLFVIPALALVTIFLFRNRKIQMRFALVLIMLTTALLIALAYYSYVICQNNSYSSVLTYTVAFPVLSLLSAILAYRGIRKDDALVKSYDRLR